MNAKEHNFPFSLNPRMLRAEPMQRCVLGECKGACCLHGVWVDRGEYEEILANAELIAAQMAETLRDPAVWFDGRVERDGFSASGEVRHTNVLPEREHYGGTACVFLREDFKCALQCAGQVGGLHPWRYKPFYCILHPLDLDEAGRITLDETAALLDEAGSCLRPSEGGKMVSLLETFAEELDYLLDGETWSGPTGGNLKG
jgi:Zn-finger nucleic acid-binding protein